MARAQARFVCQECGAVHPKWTGRCDGCGGWNSLVEEAQRDSAPKGLGGGKGRKLAFSGLEGTARRDAAASLGHCRVRPRLRRRHGAGLGAAGRRRSRHRQIHGAAAGGGGAGRGQRRRAHPLRLCLGRGVAGPGAAARRPPRRGRRAGAARRRHQHPRYRRFARRGGRARCRRHRLDPDHVSRHARQRPRDGEPGARLGAGAHPPRQAAGILGDPGRPCHQGGAHRGPARARAHGRHRALFRGRARPSVPHPARGQEPLRSRPTRSASSR